MLKFIIYMLIATLIISLCSCKTTKTDNAGNTVLTANQRHWNYAHPHGQKVRNKILKPIILKNGK